MCASSVSSERRRCPLADLRGLTPAIVTPFDDQGEVDFDSLISYVSWMKSIPGVVAIVLNSHAGEGSALTAMNVPRSSRP